MQGSRLEAYLPEFWRNWGDLIVLSNAQNLPPPPWESGAPRRFLLCQRSLRLAFLIFGGVAGIIFALAGVFYLIAPAYTAAALHAMMDLYQARADWAYRYLSGMTVVLLNNTLATLLASSLGVTAALLIAHLHVRTGESAFEEPKRGWAKMIIHAVVTGASWVLAPVRRIHHSSARVAVSVAVLAPALSVVCNGALLGIWLGSCLAEGQLAGILKGIQSIAPHAVFELPVICTASAVGLHLALHLMEVAHTQPQMIAQRAAQCLTSPALRRTWGGLFLFVLIAAVIETRISWDLQERLYAASATGVF